MNKADLLISFQILLFSKTALSASFQRFIIGSLCKISSDKNKISQLYPQ